MEEKERVRRSKLRRVKDKDIVFLETATNLPQLKSHGMTEGEKLGKRSREVITSNKFAFAELESNAMKGRMIYGGEQLKFA